MLVLRAGWYTSYVDDNRGEEQHGAQELVRTQTDRPRPLRLAVWCVRPRASKDRGGVGEGMPREIQRVGRPRVQRARGHDQGRTRRPREAPPMGALDRLLQARASAEVSGAAHPFLERDEGSRSGEEVERSQPGPEAA